ncbi:hypothetical protein O181_004642 [Austropuccinia psidii MF-1]|uniref:Uncharacterized protein n=1 Tax=Austropuccinia psidii MF-1 TaxID=1389203 RepID=A0A9Q3BH75_9BASI|nr:hypothetical protein [Austropuccinia psidii MF-1]
MLSKYLQNLFMKTPEIIMSILDPQFKLKFFITHDSTLACFDCFAGKPTCIFEDEARKNFSVTNPQKTRPPISSNMDTAFFYEMYPSFFQGDMTLENELKHFYAEPPQSNRDDPKPAHVRWPSAGLAGFHGKNPSEASIESFIRLRQSNEDDTRRG